MFSREQKWALKELLKNYPQPLHRWPGGRWASPSTTTFLDLGLTQPVRSISSEGLRALERAAIVERAHTHGDELVDQRKLTLKGWTEAVRMLGKKARALALARATPAQLEAWENSGG